MHIRTWVICRDSEIWSSIRQLLHVQGPASKTQVSHSERNKRDVSKFFVQQLIVPGEFRISERYASTRERFPLTVGQGRRVVEVDAVKVETGEFRESAESIDELPGRFSRQGPHTRSELSLEEAGIDSVQRSCARSWQERLEAGGTATARGAEALLDCSARRG